jgi:hypothetical protein
MMLWGSARSPCTSRLIGSSSIVSPGTWTAGIHQASDIEERSAPTARAISTATPSWPLGDTWTGNGAPR